MKMRKVLSLLLLAGSTTIALMIFVQKTPQNIVGINSNNNLAAVKENLQESVPELPAVVVSSAVQNIGAGIAEEIIASNPEGPEFIDEESLITAPDPKRIAEKLIKERLAQSSVALFAPEIDANAIKVVPNNDRAFIDGYLASTKAISENNFSGINSNFQNPDIEDFKKVAAAYKKTIKEYYALNVPSDMLELHKEKLRRFTQQERIFTNIANIEKDPLAALVSMRLIGQEYEDLSSLNQRIIEFAKKHNL